ncbi:MAG TPA: hypothetical protein VM345_04405 [Acidimicrobiales bacterium]|jgi:hypothetical protein|nr:hypothetical protein [Acidimicrobiales bacterium]
MDIWIKLIVGGLFAYVVIRIGFWMLRGLANPLPAPPPPGEMRRINLKYRCSMCGVELKMTAAPNEEPEPPRHCQEDMELVAPIE